MSFVNRFSTIRGPEDVALTPGGGVAVIRGVHRHAPALGPTPHEDEVVIVRTTDGTRASFQSPSLSNHGLSVSLGASDLIATTNSKAVLIGQRHFGAESTWKTCVDIIDLSDTYGLGPKWLLSWELAGAGGANDVAITPDGNWAVVNHRNFIHVFDLQTQVPSVALVVPTDTSDPSYLRDSVLMTRGTEATDPMMSVVMTAQATGAVITTHVYVIDFASGPALQGSFQLGESHHPPHDLTITPDDKLAVVTAGDAVGVIDLTPTTGPTMVLHETSGVTREYNDMADSVEVTSTQAVVIGRIGTSAPLGWRIDIY
jgi:hypothetical protein